MSTYEQRKENARRVAQEKQIEQSQKNYSWGELQAEQVYLEHLAKRYGLTVEFRENGII